MASDFPEEPSCKHSDTYVRIFKAGDSELLALTSRVLESYRACRSKGVFTKSHRLSLLSMAWNSSQIKTKDAFLAVCFTKTGKIVGMAYFLSRDPFCKTTGAWLDQIASTGEIKGIGTILLKKIADFLIGKVPVITCPPSQNSHEFYKRLGWEHAGARPEINVWQQKLVKEFELS